MTEPQDHLGEIEGFVLDALAELSDAQLDEQISFWRMMKERVTGQHVKGYSNLISVGIYERNRRHGVTPSSASAAPPMTDDLQQSTP